MGSAGLASDIVSWQGSWDNIFVLGAIPNYQGADAASFRFGLVPGNPGVVDAGANYWWRSIFCAAGGAVLTDNANTNATLVQMGEKTAQARVFAFHMTNISNRNKVLKAWNAIGTTDQTAVADAMVSLEGMWANKLGPAQCMQMVTLSKNMGAGAQFSVWGINSPTVF